MISKRRVPFLQEEQKCSCSGNDFRYYPAFPSDRWWMSPFLTNSCCQDLYVKLWDTGFHIYDVFFWSPIMKSKGAQLLVNPLHISPSPRFLMMFSEVCTRAKSRSDLFVYKTLYRDKESREGMSLNYCCALSLAGMRYLYQRLLAASPAEDWWGKSALWLLPHWHALLPCILIGNCCSDLWHHLLGLWSWVTGFQ